MRCGYCLLYLTSNRLYVIHAVDTKHLLLVDGVNSKSVFYSTKLVEDIPIDEIIHKMFLDPQVAFLTNISRETFVYQKLRSLLPASPSIIKDLSSEDLDLSRRKFIDCLAGKNIKFDTIRHQRKVFQYLNQDEISPNLIPYLLLIHSTKIKPNDWLRKLVKK